MQMKLDELTQRGCGESAEIFREGDTKYQTTESKVLAVVQLQTVYDAASSALTALGEPMETHTSVPGKSRMPHMTS